MAAVEPELLSKETIKPSIPTSENLRTYKLSFLDHVAPNVYARNIFFFASKPSDQRPTTTSNIKESLSKLLSVYYPFTGRIKDKVSFNCNDDGFEFFESRIACQLADVLEQPDIEKMYRFLPLSSDSSPKDFDPKSLAVVQVTHFDCGGIAVGTLFSTKLCDVQSIATFMNDWASITLDPSKSFSPQFIGASVLPLPSIGLLPVPPPERQASKIEALKAEAQKGSLGSIEPTANEAIVAALIFKCIAAAMKSTGSRKKLVMYYAGNMREMTTPPLPENSIGNFGAPSIILVGEEEIELQKISEKLKASQAEMVEKYSKKESEAAWSWDMYKGFLNLVRMVLTGPWEIFTFGNCCRLPFYEVDFGWGKPVWVGSTCLPLKNRVVIRDGKREGEIEVLVGLEDELMAIFERSDELLSFASLNPSVPLN
ncbi:hypothetical protein Ancab_018979 [Ancistrocladus abbreviatus]